MLSGARDPNRELPTALIDTIQIYNSDATGNDMTGASHFWKKHFFLTVLSGARVLYIARELPTALQMQN
ncbi:MAG: hypothetical protein EAZ94_02915 [Oscillatoriales cyanobacterium]|nr:MAG: hypothetical protein EAZ94_02915 [Oscillatoriales cyanobacterium]TAE25909.1 MAG: hypothetical protein EAZ93_09350 [Oscillatoriales cyanobacterium]